MNTAAAAVHAPPGEHCSLCGHQHFELGSGDLLTRGEKWWLGTRLSLAVLAAGLLIIGVLWRWLAPEQAALAGVVDALAAALVSVPVLWRAWKAIGDPDLEGITDQIVGIALLAAWVAGDLQAAALVPLAMVLGHVLEERSVMGSREAIAALGRLTQTRVRRLRPDGSIEEVGAETVQPGERIELRAGDRVGADGVVREGRSSVDTAALTGESVPREVGIGEGVFAGSIVHDGRLVVEVTRAGTATTLARVVDLLRDAERAKPPVTRMLERYAALYLPLVLCIGLAALFLSGDVLVMMAVLVASCPCALAVAAPATAIAALAVASRHAVLVKGTAFLEELGSCDSLVIDKTGTLTLGQLRLVDVQPVGGFDAVRARRVAASLGAASSHPVSRAVAAAVPVDERVAVADLREQGGLGLTGSVDGQAVLLGRADLLRQSGVAVGELPTHDGPLVALAVGGQLVAWMLLADTARASAAEALADLRTLGLSRQVLLTGDRRAVAERVGHELGITEVEAEVLPEQKLDRVRAEIAAGHRPLVVGDGINDALALRAGAVGVAVGGPAGGTDVALGAADVVLLSDDLRRLGTAIRLSRLGRRTINQNVAMALGWTVLVFSAAALGWLRPEVVALIHNVGTIAVMINSGRMLRWGEQR